MKHTLGKALLLVFLYIGSLYAEDFVYDVHTNTHTAYLKEPLFLSIDINQTNPDVVLLFHFKINKSNAYHIEQLASTQDHTSHHTKIHYLYLLYPLKTGDINVTFDLVKRVTNDASITYFFSGDRDDFKKLETVDTSISVPPVSLHIKPLSKEVQLIGDFKLSYRLKTTHAKSHEPIPMQVTLEGYGYPPILKDILPKILHVTRFTHKPTVQKTISTKGINYKVVYNMALSSAKSFTLPQINLHAFNPHTQKPYLLSIPEQHFTILPVDAQTLVDNIDMPKRLTGDLSWIQTLMGYLAVFAAGYLTALALKWKSNKQVGTKHPLQDKIKDAKDAKSLLRLLLSADDTRFTGIIGRLESSIYGESKINLSKIKQETQELL